MFSRSFSFTIHLVKKTMSEDMAFFVKYPTKIYLPTVSHRWHSGYENNCRHT
jgi:hypothetical protein